MTISVHGVGARSTPRSIGHSMTECGNPERCVVAGSIYDEDPELHAEAEAQRKRYCESVRGVRWHDLEIIKFCDAESRLEGRPLVKGILEHEQTSMMVGETGCGKTFLALDLGLHIAA